MTISLPEKEPDRLQALKNYRILDTPPEQDFDDITFLASYICETPIALITLLDETRQWFKSKVGVSVDQTSREVAFCNHAILQSEMFIVKDALADERFVNNPLVTGQPGIRFYAGSQLMTTDGYGLGTLCVMDRKPRELTPQQLMALQRLARQVISQLELRRISYNLKQTNKAQVKLITELGEALNQIKTLEGIIPMCANCKKIRDDEGYWEQVEIYIKKHSDADFSHGICPDCKSELYPEFYQSLST